MIEYKGKLIVDTIDELLDSSNLVNTISKDDRGNKYSNNIVTFDTESCQVKVDDDISVACTITYQIAVNDRCILVRTPESFLEVLYAVSNKLGKDDVVASTGRLMKKGVKVIVFTHNLQYDAYFTVWDVLLKTNIPVKEVFIIKKKFNKYNFANLQFRCSQMLTNMSLDTAIKEYVPPENRPEKLKGYWDYKLYRSPLTKLTMKEILYACVDVLGLVDVIRGLCKLHSIEVGQMPVASTSFTRKACKDYCLGKTKYKTSAQKAYYNLIHSLNLDYEMVCMAHEAFRGGISDTNRAFADEIQYDVGDWDINSEYPSVINNKLYPMSTPVWEKCTYEQLYEWAFNTYKYKKGFITRVIVHNFRAKNNHIIPIITKYNFGKYDKISDFQDTRIFEGEQIELFLSDPDFRIFVKDYDFDSMDVIKTMTYEMKLLPKLMREFILNGYKSKTSFKGVKGKEIEYKLAKTHINAIYGIMATYPIMDQYEMTSDEIIKLKKSDEEKIAALEKYNKNVSRFTYYLWGVYTAAYGHEQLCEGLRIVGTDVIACDTDSVKFKNKHKYMDKFRELNEKITQQYKLISEYDNIPWDKYSPADPKGVIHTIGTWDDDSKNLVAMVSKRSKCYLKIFEKKAVVDEDLIKEITEPDLGPESAPKLKVIVNGDLIKVMTEPDLGPKSAPKLKAGYVILDGELKIGEEIKYRYYKITTAGIKPDAALKEFQRRVDLGDFKSIEDAFIANIKIPAECTGKLTHVYYDDQKPFTYTDYQGNEYTMTNQHCITLDDAPFAFTPKDIDKDYYLSFFEDESCYL